jgi:hypothetical protein
MQADTCRSRQYLLWWQQAQHLHSQLHITDVVRWLDAAPAREELYRDSELILYVITADGSSREKRKRAEHSELWNNLRTWITFYHQHRCRRIVEPSTDSQATPRAPDFPWIDTAIKIFDLIDTLLENDDELTTEDLISTLESLRRGGPLPSLRRSGPLPRPSS